MTTSKRRRSAVARLIPADEQHDLAARRFAAACSGELETADRAEWADGQRDDPGPKAGEVRKMARMAKGAG